MTKLRILGAFALFAVVCLLLPVRSFAQGGSISSITFGPNGTPKGGVTVTVCASTATVVGGVCTPAESDAACCFTDSTLGTRLTPPPSGGTILSDGLGNYTVWAAPGLYKVSYSGAGVTSTTLTVPVSCVPGGTNCTGLGAQLNAANHFTSTSANTFPNLNNILYVDGTTYTTVQAAINALPVGATGGGTVVIPPGSYACPTSMPSGVTLVNSYGWWAPTVPPQIWSKFNGAAFNSFSSGPGSQNMVKFTGCTLNLTDVSQVAILGIVLDYGGAANMTMTGVSWSQFAMAVVNTATTAPALTLIGDSSFGTSNNSFPWLFLEGGNGGLSIGTASAVKFSTVNTFGWVYLLADAQPTGTYTGVKFVANCDSTQFKRVSVYTTNVISNFTGVLFNSSSATAAADVSAEFIEMYEETMNGAPATSTSFVINPSTNNIFTTGSLQSLVQTSVTSWAGTSQYTWHQSGYVAGTPNVEIASIFQATKSLIVGSGGSQVAKIVTGSGTLTYSAIPANSCQEQALSVTGAVQATGAWSASPTTGLGNTGLSWSAVSSPSGNNSVIVRVCNVTVGSITPTAVTWYVAGMQ